MIKFYVEAKDIPVSDVVSLLNRGINIFRYPQEYLVSKITVFKIWQQSLTVLLEPVIWILYRTSCFNYVILVYVHLLMVPVDEHCAQVSPDLSSCSLSFAIWLVDSGTKPVEDTKT